MNIKTKIATAAAGIAALAASIIPTAGASGGGCGPLGGPNVSCSTLGTAAQVIYTPTPQKRLHVEWDASTSQCVIFPDFSGYCWTTGPIIAIAAIDGQGTSLYTGQTPEYGNWDVTVGMTWEHYEYHIYMPTPADPNLQHPLVMFGPRR